MQLQELSANIQYDKPAIWCGAGISVRSGLPTARQLLVYLLNKLKISATDVDFLSTSRMPFELVVELLLPVLDFESFLRIFNARFPNVNHLLIARLARERKVQTIFTTNFDTLIEQALQAEGLLPDKDFEVLKSPTDFKKIDWHSDYIRIIKLHGSANDPQTVATTLQRVAARELQHEQSEVIAKAFSNGPHNRLLVFGYSFSDAFDINPQIRLLTARRKPAIVLQHNDSPKLTRRRDLESELRQLLAARSSDFTVLAVNTDVAIARLWKQLFKQPVPSSRSSHNWQTMASRAMTRVNKPKRLRTIGRLLEVAGNLNRAEFYLRNALSADSGSDDFVRGQILTDLGRLANATGDYTGGIAYGQKALSLARNMKDRRGEAAILGNLANAKHNMGRYHESIRLNLRSAKIAHKLPNGARVEASSYGNLGLTYRVLGRYVAAARCHKRAARIGRKINDRHLEAHQLGNIAVCHRYLGDLNTCRTTHDQALALIRTLGDLRAEAIELGNIGNVERLFGNHNEALRLYRQAYRLAHKTANQREQWNASNNIAEVHLAAGRLISALRWARLGLGIANRINSPQGQVTLLITLSEIAIATRRQHKAREYATEALAITRRAFPSRHPLTRAAIATHRAVTL